MPEASAICPVTNDDCCNCAWLGAEGTTYDIGVNSLIVFWSIVFVVVAGVVVARPVKITTSSVIADGTSAVPGLLGTYALLACGDGINVVVEGVVCTRADETSAVPGLLGTVRVPAFVGCDGETVNELIAGAMTAGPGCGSAVTVPFTVMVPVELGTLKNTFWRIKFTVPVPLTCD